MYNHLLDSLTDSGLNNEEIRRRTSDNNNSLFDLVTNSSNPPHVRILFNDYWTLLDYQHPKQLSDFIHSRLFDCDNPDNETLPTELLPFFENVEELERRKSKLTKEFEEVREKIILRSLREDVQRLGLNRSFETRLTGQSKDEILAFLKSHDEKPFTEFRDVVFDKDALRAFDVYQDLPEIVKNYIAHMEMARLIQDYAPHTTLWKNRAFTCHENARAAALKENSQFGYCLSLQYQIDFLTLPGRPKQKEDDQLVSQLLNDLQSDNEYMRYYDYRCYRYYGRLLIQTRRFEEAIEQYEIALKRSKLRGGDHFNAIVIEGVLLAKKLGKQKIYTRFYKEFSSNRFLIEDEGALKKSYRQYYDDLFDNYFPESE